METKLMVVTNAKKGSKLVPRMRLGGKWLNEIGFEYGKLAAIQYEQGRIFIKLHDVDNYRDLVRGALKDGSSLFQICGKVYSSQKIIPHINLAGIRLETLGFSIGSHIAVRYEYGSIQITLVHLDQLIDLKEMK